MHSESVTTNEQFKRYLNISYYFSKLIGYKKKLNLPAV